MSTVIIVVQPVVNIIHCDSTKQMLRCVLATIP